MESVIRTVYGTHLQTCLKLNLPYTVYPHTTLNEKLNIFPDLTLASGELPSARYMVIGNGGHRFSLGNGTVPVVDPILHNPTDAGLYQQIPFVARALDNDLTAAQRARYRLRRIETYNNVNYAVYYARVVSLKGVSVQLELKEVDNGSITAQPFIPTLSNLNPTPPAVTPNQVITATGNYVSATAIVDFSMDEWEMNELLNVANLLYGDDRYAIISEIGLCSGVDRNVTGQFNGVSTGYTDAAVVQITNFINVFHSAKFTNTGFNLTMDIGSLEPLYA